MSVTLPPKTQPHRASWHKIYVDGPRGIRVPMRQIHLTDETSFRAYDTSGAHTDPGLSIDVRKGIQPLRARWIAERQDVEELGQSSSEYRRARTT